MIVALSEQGKHLAGYLWFLKYAYTTVLEGYFLYGLHQAGLPLVELLPWVWKVGGCVRGSKNSVIL